MTEEMKKLCKSTEQLWSEVMADYKLLPPIEEQAGYWNAAVDNYETEAETHRANAEFVFSAIKERGLTDKCSSALEIGGGTGALARLLASDIEKVTCVDISDGMLRKLEEKNRLFGVGNIESVCCNYMDIPEGRTFDLVGACLVPTTYSAEGLRRMVSLSKKGGYYMCGCGALASGTNAYRELGRILVGDDRPVKQDPIYAFDLLYSMGLYPKIHYRYTHKTVHWDEETAIKKLSLYFRDAKEKPQGSDEIIADYVKKHLEDGVLTVRSDGAFAVITWES